jgi:hypothetical protein
MELERSEHHEEKYFHHSYKIKMELNLLILNFLAEMFNTQYLLKFDLITTEGHSAPVSA